MDELADRLAMTETPEKKRKWKTKYGMENSSDDEEDDLYDDDVGASPTTRPGPVSPARAAAKSA